MTDAATRPESTLMTEPDPAARAGFGHVGTMNGAGAVDPSANGMGGPAAMTDTSDIETSAGNGTMADGQTQALTSWATTRPQLNAGRFMRAFVRVNVYLYSKPPSKLSKTINKLGIKLNVAAYRLSHGKVLGRFGDLDALLITTTGRKSGRSRTVPLGYLYDQGRFIVVAVPGHFDIPGGPKALDPSWYLNLRADPKATINIGMETINVTGQVAEGEDHDRYWSAFTTAYPFIGEFFKRADREPPVVILTPDDLNPQEL